MWLKGLENNKKKNHMFLRHCVGETKNFKRKKKIQYVTMRGKGW